MIFQYQLKWNLKRRNLYVCLLLSVSKLTRKRSMVFEIWIMAVFFPLFFAFYFFHRFIRMCKKDDCIPSCRFQSLIGNEIFFLPEILSQSISLTKGEFPSWKCCTRWFFREIFSKKTLTYRASYREDKSKRESIKLV